MLEFPDSVSRRRPIGRRRFLQIGRLGGITAPWLLNTQARAGASGTGGPVTGKSVVFRFQQAGPSQHETFAPKTEVSSASASVGGHIATSVPGTRFGDSMKNLSRPADRIAVVRN